MIDPELIAAILEEIEKPAKKKELNEEKDSDDSNKDEINNSEDSTED
jgi:hypothetical protein